MKHKPGIDERESQPQRNIARPDKPTICVTCGTRYSQAKYDAARCPGSTILYHADSESVFVGDTLQVSRDKKHLSVMHSFPNFIPLMGEETLRVFRRVAPLRFDAMYGAFSHQNLPHGARAVFDQSLRRYEMIFGGQGRRDL